MRRAVNGQVDLHRGSRVVAVDNKIVGQVFALFANCSDALSCAISCLKVTESMDCELAIGMGYGEVLDLDGCNAFGDAVNMAFKLGEDTAKAGEILLTDNVFNNLTRKIDMETERRSVEISGVQIKHRCVVYDSKRASAIRMAAAASSAIMGWNKSGEYTAMPKKKKKRLDIGK
jgi:hypothetical protein